MKTPRPSWQTQLYGKIETREDALRVIKDCTNTFYFLAILQAVVGAFLDPSLIGDALLFAALAFVLWKFRSRIAAILLLILTCAAVVVTASNAGGAVRIGGTNIILAIVVLWAAIRAVQATFRLRRLRG